MSINWQQIIAAVIATVGGGGVCLAAAAWLLKSVITARLKANTDAEIERLKAALKAEADLAIERLKSELQIEHVRFSRLHEKRAEIIADLYKQSVNVESEAKRFIFQFGRTPRDEKGQVDATKLLYDFNTFVDQHRIYLSDRVCELLGTFSALLTDPIVHAYVYGDIRNPNVQTVLDLHAGIKKALDAFANEIPAARRELEREFRQILGVTSADETQRPAR